MKRLLIGLATAGLLLSTPAFAQSNDQGDKDKPAATSTDTKASGGAKVNVDSGRLQNDPKQNKAGMKAEIRERHGDRDRRSESTRTRRTTVGVRVGERHEIRMRHRHCRTIVVKKRYHHRVVVRHIRRCY